MCFACLEAIVQDDANRKYYHAWLQSLTGSWPRWEEAGIEATSFSFALGIAARVLFSIGPILALFAIFERVFSEGRETMKVLDIIRLRDRAIKNEILGSTNPELRPEEKDKIEKAFRDGNARWASEHLRTLLGKERAEKFVKQLNEEPNV